ncbi:MAG: glycine zipper domain-containing protein [Gammaproteobacteria bacterium]
MRALLPPLLLSLGLIGCTFPAPQPDVYQRSETGRAFGVDQGSVVMIRTVPIAGRSTAVGRIGGAYVGAAAGAAVGDGLGRVVASSVGAVAGAVAGEAVEERVTRRDGLEITIQMDSGNTITIVQDAELEFVEGERVRVLLRANDMGKVLKY